MLWEVAAEGHTDSVERILGKLSCQRTEEQANLGSYRKEQWLGLCASCFQRNILTLA